MPVTDTFLPPSLDATKWTSYKTGATALQVGFPTNGCFPHGVDSIGDHVYIESKGKITFSANRYFRAQILYSDAYVDDDEKILYYFGYRSNQQDMFGEPLYGVDLMICSESGPVYTYQKRVISGGSVSVSNIIPNPFVPAASPDGGFRIIRNDTVYSLYQFDGVFWNLLSDVDLGFKGAGYIRFGVYAENPGLA